MRRGSVTKKTIYYVVSSIVAVILMFPFIYMFLRSFMTQDQVMATPVEMFPRPIYFGAYVSIFDGGEYFLALIETLKIVGFNCIAIPLSATFVGYGFARMKFPGKDLVFSVMLGTMMIPGAVLQVPLYVMFTKFGWVDTFMPLTIPNLFGGGAVYIFLIRQFMRGIPIEIEEAGKIDGANPYVRYFRLVLPLCWPVIIYVIVNIFNANWGDFYGPLIYMSGSERHTLAYAVFQDAMYAESAAAKENVRMAAGVFMSFFPVILFIVFQKQLIEGVAVASLKG